MSSSLLQNLIALALLAGREILAVRDAGFSAEKKHDGSLVTIADQRAETLIEQGLARLAPDVPMVGEEAVAAGRIPHPGARFFCVDALDGTRGFVKGGDEFTVNIALVDTGAPTHGVIFAPASGELYAGEPGRAFAGRADARTGAMLNPLCPIRTNADTPTQWRVVASDFSGRNEKTKRFISALNSATTHASSSIKFCRLAEGAAELYPRFGDVNEWDIAAGHAILSAAGGGAMTLDGTPIAYGGRGESFLVHAFIAYSSDAAKSAALSVL